MAIKKYCSKCNSLMNYEGGNYYCELCKDKIIRNNNRAYNIKRYSNDEERKYKRFYNSAAWQRVKGVRLLLDNGLCQECLNNNKLTKAITVHHIVELRDDWEKRLDLDNLISLCHDCHNDKHNRF